MLIGTKWLSFSTFTVEF